MMFKISSVTVKMVIDAVETFREKNSAVIPEDVQEAWVTLAACMTNWIRSLRNQEDARR